MEIKKAVFVEPGHSADDEGVSLSATPASEDKAEVATASAADDKKQPAIVIEVKKDPIFATTMTQPQGQSKQPLKAGGRSNNDSDIDDAIGEEDEIDVDETQAMLEAKNNLPAVTSTASSSNHEQFTEHRVNAVVSQPPKEQQQQQQYAQHQVQHHQQVQQQQQAQLAQQVLNAHQEQTQLSNVHQQHGGAVAAASQQNYNSSSTSATSDHQYFYQQMQVGPSIPTTRKPPQQLPAFGHPLANVLPQQQQTAVSQQQQLQATSAPAPPSRRTAPLRTLREKERDVVVTHQDINGVNTVALKELDVQMTQMSGYETYV